MKSFRATLVMGLMVAGLIGLALWDSRRNEKKNEAEAKSKLVFGFEKDKVSEIEIQGNHKFRLLKTNGKWSIENPSVKMADQNEVETFLNSLLAETAEPLEAASDGTSTKDFGFEGPVMSVKIAAGVEAKTIEISTRRTFDDRAYIRKQGESRVELGGMNWGQTLSRDVLSFRDRTIFSMPQAVTKMEQLGPDGKILWSIEKAESQWRVSKPETLRKVKLNASSIEQYLTNLELQKAETVESDDIKLSLLPTFGLTKPLSIFSITADQKVMRFLIGTLNKVDFYLWQKDSPTVFKTTINTAQMLAPELASWVDSKTWVDFDPSQVKFVKIEDPKFKVDARRENGQWLSESSSVNSEKISQLLDRLKIMKAASVSEIQPEPQGRRIVLKSEKGASILTLQFGLARKTNRLLGGQQSLISVRSSMFSGIFAIEETDYLSLPGQDMIEVSKPAAEKKDQSIDQNGNGPS